MQEKKNFCKISEYYIFNVSSSPLLHCVDARCPYALSRYNSDVVAAIVPTGLMATVYLLYSRCVVNLCYSKKIPQKSQNFTEEIWSLYL